eukprot:CAMPEP_0168743784 /NCGR_PEP_ID=MMETSP0724-20121128/13756_1 /TAXON_ID=265536 /ORGANISM="Amphiprora sp., Strain CCMP467" /LENGTH=558 /DNA_ID=CAMNT_0008791427 /DNA_START=31 /DNA_END=1707 /DNA_ORIENTATION=+
MKAFFSSAARMSVSPHNGNGSSNSNSSGNGNGNRLSGSFGNTTEHYQTLIHSPTPKVTLLSVLWKRRGGVSGKFASFKSAWERRTVCLKGHVLFYWASTEQEQDTITTTSTDKQLAQLDPTRIRGSVDLVQERATVQASPTGHEAGAPSPFCFTIKANNHVTGQPETLFKFCSESQETATQWLTALTHVTMSVSVDLYNQALLTRAQQQQHQQQATSSMSLLVSSSCAEGGMLSPPPVYEPGTLAHKNNTHAPPPPPQEQAPVVAAAQHQLWMMEPLQLDQQNDNDNRHSDPTTTMDPTVHEAAAHALDVMKTLVADKEKARMALELKVHKLQQQVSDLAASQSPQEQQQQHIEELHRQWELDKEAELVMVRQSGALAKETWQQEREALQNEIRELKQCQPPPITELEWEEQLKLQQQQQAQAQQQETERQWQAKLDQSLSEKRLVESELDTLRLSVQERQARSEQEASEERRAMDEHHQQEIKDFTRERERELRDKEDTISQLLAGQVALEAKVAALTSQLEEQAQQQHQQQSQEQQSQEQTDGYQTDEDDFQDCIS